MKVTPVAIHLPDRVLRLEAPAVMGILNATPDSFSDGGRYQAVDAALARAVAMVEDGALILDIGGESTRPGSEPVSEEEELRRVLPVIEAVRAALPETVLSIDTTKYRVAEEALKRGVQIINDISGLRFEPRLAALAAGHGAALVLMHSIGNPKTMQQQPEYADVVAEVEAFLREKTAQAVNNGVKTIVWDYGLGFGKTLDHNRLLLQHTARFAASGHAVLAGASRKSFIGVWTGGRPATERMAGSVAAHLYAAAQGALLLRVHDVRETADALKVWQALSHK